VIESVNPSALRQFGYDDEAEMIGQPFASVVGDSTGHRKDGSTFAMELGVDGPSARRVRTVAHTSCETFELAT
jgi:hypothetical protein